MKTIPRFLTVLFLLLTLVSAPGAPADRRPSPGFIVQSLFAATTPSGKTLSAQQLKPLILHATWPPGMSTRGYWHLKIGVFLLAVRSDGTVANVEKLQSTGHRGLDGEMKVAFMKWRFRPNSVNSVRVPAYYTFSWR
jgi:TonB family protein